MSFEFRNSTSELVLRPVPILNQQAKQFAYQGVRTQLKANLKLTRKEIKELWPKAREDLEFFGRYLPKQRLIRAIEVLSDARKRRFLRRRTPKYGTINKGFTESELIKFLSAVEEPKMKLLFTFQAILGLRIGEAVKLHVKDINLQTKELKIDNQKGGRFDTLPLPTQLFEQSVQFISDYEDAIVKAKGQLFWADNYPERNNCPYLSKDYARNIFRKTIDRLKLNETYGLAEGQIPKLLHRLTTHSLRHYAITNFSKKNNGNVVLTSKFARHHRIETTMIYIHTGKEELYQSISLAQEDGVLEKVRQMQKKM